MNEKRPISKGQRIAALVVVILLLSMYVLTFVLAIFAKPGANRMFLASLLCTIIIPVILYVTMWLMRKMGENKENNEK